MWGNIMQCEILGFRRQVAKNCAFLGYYAASGDNSLPTFRDNLLVPSSGFKDPFVSLNPENGADSLSRNVGKKLPLLDA